MHESAALPKALLTVVTVLFGAAPVHAQAVDSTGTVFGLVTGSFDGRRMPLPFAQIEALARNGRRSVMADEGGRYRVAGLAPGVVRLRVEHAGHAPLRVEVSLPPGVEVRFDLELTAAPLELDPLEVLGDRRVPEPSPRDTGLDPPPRPEIEVQALDLTPGVGNPGLLDAVQTLPGNDPANATDVLYMRGSTADLKLVLLDGAPVFTPFHVAGLMRSFEPAVLGSAALHVGGAPARYDGGLTHILDLETRRPRRDRWRGSGTADLLAATSAVEGPLGDGAGLLASFRALHDLGSTPLRGQRPYGYRDALLSVELEPRGGQTLRATGFQNRETVLLDFPAAPDDASWSNRAASLTWEADAGDVHLHALGALSAYDASLPLQPGATDQDPEPDALLAQASNDRVRALIEASWGGPRNRTRVGASHERIDARYAARTLGGSGASSGSRSSKHSTGVFLDATLGLAPQVTLRTGLRADAFSVGGVRLAPRAAITWAFDPEALITVAAGRYHQATRSPDVEVERTLSEVVESALPSEGLLPVATADHVVVSLDQRLGQRVRLGLQGFWKRYEGLETSPRETVRSSGIDLRVSSVGSRSVFWLGYGLSWFWSTEDLSGYSSDFAGRHLLSAGLSGDLGGPLRGELRVAYGAGLPFTAIPFRSVGASDEASAPPDDLGTETRHADPPLVGGLDAEFLRIDLELHADLRGRWGGRAWTVRPYLRVLNALDRRDALFYTFQPWRSDELTPLAERPFLPILGVAFSF